GRTLDLVDVRHHPHGQVAAARLGVEGERQALQVAVQVVANLGEHAAADQVEADRTEVVGEPAQRGDHDHGHDHGCQELAGVEPLQELKAPGAAVVFEKVVEDELHGPGGQRVEAGFHQERQQRTDHHGAVLAHVVPEV